MIEPSTFLEHWLGHRRLTRRMVDAFHPDQLFTYSPAPPLRPFGEMVWEIHETTTYTLSALLSGSCPPTSRGEMTWPDRAALLADWDALSVRLKTELPTLPATRYREVQPFPWRAETGFQAATGEIDNEIHHRGQATVYLRLLGITPPDFWERG